MNSSARILYIEDDPVNMLLVKKLLRVEGFEIIEATNGLSGIEMAKEQKPDLILLDINMPDLDGYTAASYLKSIPSLQDIPIVAVTANAMASDKKKSFEAGCDGFITKPIDIKKFGRQVRFYLTRINALPVGNF